MGGRRPSCHRRIERKNQRRAYAIYRGKDEWPNGARRLVVAVLSTQGHHVRRTGNGGRPVG